MRSARLVLVLLLFAGCGGADPADAPPEEITGVIVDINSAGLDDVRSFELKAGDDHYEIFIDPERDYGFPLSHLNEHRMTGDPVRVDLEDRDGDLYALAIDDA